MTIEHLSGKLAIRTGFVSEKGRKEENQDCLGTKIPQDAALAAKGVASEQGRVDQQHEAPHAHPKILGCNLTTLKKRDEGVVIEDDDESQCEIQGVAVKILEEQEGWFAFVAFLRQCPHSTAGRGRRKGSIVGFSVVITGEAKRPGKDQDEQRRWRRQKGGPPPGPGTKPGVSECEC